MRWMDAFSTPSHFEKTTPAVKYFPASFGKKCITGMQERSGFCITNFPSFTIFPSKVASASFFTSSFSSMPSARESVWRLAVRFMTTRAPSMLWKNRTLSVEAASFAACISGEHGSLTSMTKPSFRIFSINSRIITTPAPGERMIDAEVIEHPGHHHIHEIVNLFRVVIEPRACGHDGRPGFVRRKHVCQVNL